MLDTSKFPPSEFQKAYKPEGKDNFDRIFGQSDDTHLNVKRPVGTEFCQECGAKGTIPNPILCGRLCPKCGLYWGVIEEYHKETGEDPY